MEKETIENLFEENNNVEVNAFADLPPVAPVDYEQSEETVTEQSIESIQEEVVSEQSVGEIVETKEEQPVEENNEYVVNKEVLEHPDAKITLNNEKEEVIDKKEIEELKDVKLSDNSSLRFVLILGLILLVVIFLIPFVSEYI